MNRLRTLLALALFGSFFGITQPGYAQQDLLETWLSNLPDVTYDTIAHHPDFSRAYVLRFEQPVDHSDPYSPTFTQRVFLFHKDFSKPVVFVTEGYAAAYAQNPGYINELSQLLDANEIVVEHRYFGESVPDPLDWDHLNVFNAASDHHHVVELFKGLYRGTWINTGISKGGQTAMYHRCFYPRDVDATVGYVCPLNFSIKDERIFPFLEQVGDSVCRSRIFNYQLEMLQGRDQYFHAFRELAAEKDLTYPLGEEAGYELTIMEYSFAFWQWGRWSCDEIPEKGTPPEEMVSHLDAVASLDWVSDQGIFYFVPFFYQALTEIGFYGYDLKPFHEHLKALEGDVFTFDFTCPEGADCGYDPIPMQEVDHFIRHKANHMMFIYGGTDPWSATHVQPSGNNSVVTVFKPGGAHSARIRNLPEDQRQYVVQTLEEWLGTDINE